MIFTAHNSEFVVKCGEDSGLEVLATFLLIDYDHNMSLLYRDLQQFLQDRFGNSPVVFEPHQRLVFIHDDLDGFINDQFPPLTLYNLQLILRELDISNFFCAIISNLPNYHIYTEMCRTMLTHDDYSIKAISSVATSICPYDVPRDVAINTGSITRPWILQSRLSRWHRTYFVSRVFHRNLQDQGVVTYHNISHQRDAEMTQRDCGALDTHVYTDRCNFLTTQPFVRNPAPLLIANQTRRDQARDFQLQFTHYVNAQEPVAIEEKMRAATMAPNPLIEQCLVYVGLETAVNQPQVFVSNISFKGLVQKRPFLLLGAPGLLKQIKSWGFQTFDRWWDESYDQEKDFEVRVELMVDIMEKLSNMNTNELQKLADEMQSVLDYNYHHFTQVFPSLQRQLIVEGLRR